MMSNNELQRRIHNCELYFSGESELIEEQHVRLEKLYEFNLTRQSDQERRNSLIKEMFAEVGEGCYIDGQIYCNFGGKHVHFGNYVYANMNLTLVDDTHIYVGDYTMFGPNVMVLTAGHPILPELRQRGLQFNAPVYIGKRCWIGAGAIILPGVTIGDESVIGAGSVVTKDIPPGVVAVGNPCHVLREIGQRDKKYYFREHQINE